MRVLTKEELEREKEYFLLKVGQGAVFIYPTDTIYGIGCNARDPVAIKELRRIKKRETTPFSIIVPGKDWIEKNCILDERAKMWINRLPGPLTLILKLKNKDAIWKNVAPGLDTVGVRIPDHWISQFVKDLDIPLITTSANVKGGRFMTSLDNLDLEVKENVEFAVYEGENKGSPSKIINLSGKETEIKTR